MDYFFSRDGDGAPVCESSVAVDAPAAVPAVTSEMQPVRWLPIEQFAFVSGHCYLFAVGVETECTSGMDSLLWAIFDEVCGDRIGLEAATADGSNFRYWLRLPSEYRYVRPMTREEVRDFSFNHGYAAALAAVRLRG